MARPAPTPLAAPVRRRKPRGLGHERPAEILAAAKEMFVADGYAAFTTRKLAERVGLSQTGLYVYFKSKDELLDAVCRDAYAQLIAATRRAEARMAPGLDRLRALLRGFVAFGLKHPGEYQLIFMLPRGLLADEAKTHGQPFEAQGIGVQSYLLFKSAFEDLDAAGLLKIADPRLAAQASLMAMHGVVAMLIARPEFPWTNHKRLIDAVIETHIAGLAAQGAGRSKGQ